MLVTGSKTGELRTVYANKEIILSAGAIRTPFSSIITAIAIDVKIDLPTVDENLQDQLDFNTKLQVAMMKYTRKFHKTAPLGDLFAEETTPGLEAVPDEAGDETWTKWVHENYRSNFHSVGTTAMMSRELGGVVDSHLRLSGARNARIVDAGVILLQTCGPLVGTL